MSLFKKNRTKLSKKLPSKSVFILDSPPLQFRQDSVAYPYRQDSNFYWLTGFEQMDSLFLLFPSGKSILFSMDKDPVKETWDGKIFSKEEIKKEFQIDEVYYLSEMEAQLKKILKGNKVFYEAKNPSFDKVIKKEFKGRFESTNKLIRPLRMIKEKEEVALIKKAVKASIKGHKSIAKALKPGVNERELHGVFLKSTMKEGSPREAYGGIIACGDNANTLHYKENNCECKEGELLLVDAGAEMGYYSSDITRVYPVSGKFSKKQKELYNELLKLQESLIELVKPGRSLKEINRSMFEGVTKILIKFKILKGSLKENLKKGTYRKYIPHSVGHLLGLDVHDLSFEKEEEPILKENMILTIEPGIYISKNDKSAPSSLRAVGLRIEDDILVTKKGRENLTKALTKKASEIEALCS